MTFKRKFKKTAEHAIEENKDYIAYRDMKAFADTDIPLVSEREFFNFRNTPSAVWEEYDRETEQSPVQLLSEEQNRSVYLLTTVCLGQTVTMETHVFKPPHPQPVRTVIAVGEYGVAPQPTMIEKLTEDGYFVVVPDYCGVFPHTKTSFPDALHYGRYGQSGTHLTRIQSSPRDTNNFLYASMLRRAVAFALRLGGNPILLAVRSGIEYAMQTAGIDKRVIGLACVGGCGYSELSDDGDALPTSLQGERLAWMTGVSGVSYLKGRDLPVLIALGSNATLGNIDRVASLQKILAGRNRLHLVVSSGCTDNIDLTAFSTVRKWLRLAFLESQLPEPPLSCVNTNKDGSVYANVSADSVIPPKSATFYYASGNENHSLRAWNWVSCETVGNGEFIAKLPPLNGKTVFYGEIEYENGIVLSGFISSCVCKSDRLAPPAARNSVIYSYGEKDDVFSEINDGAVLFETGIHETVLPVGLKGIVCDHGSMVVFPGDVTSSIAPEKILQIDSFYPGEYTLDVTLVDRETNIYHASKFLSAVDTFEKALFECSDFKDGTFRTLTSWSSVRCLRIEKEITIGKLLFI